MNRLSDKLKTNPITRNAAPKLASLLFAVLLWIYVMDVENPDMLKVIKNVEVTVVGMDILESEGLVLLESQMPTVDVTVKGRRTEVNNIDRSDIRLSIDIGALKQGEHNVSIDRTILSSNVIITSISRRAQAVVVDKLAEELKPVTIVFKGEAKPGFLTEAAVPDPPMVLISGPETLVKQVTVLQGEVESVSITAMTEAQIPIRAVNSTGKTIEGVTAAAKSVKATLSLFQVKSLAVNPQLTGRVPEGFELVDVQIEPDSVTLKGAEDLLKNFTYLKTKPINLNTLSQTDTLNVELDLPEGITAPDLEGPLRALVRIEPVKVRELTYGPEEVTFINPASGTVGKLTEPLKIRVRGIESLVDVLSKDDVRIRVDLANQGPGRINANVIYDAAAKYSTLKIEPGRVEVEIGE